MIPPVPVNHVLVPDPDPVPGNNPLMLDTMSVDAVMAGEVILVVTVNVLPVRVDI